MTPSDGTGDARRFGPPAWPDVVDLVGELKGELKSPQPPVLRGQLMLA